MKNVKKEKNGKYRIRKTYNGKTYSITLDHKPTQKELDKIFNDFYDRPETGKHGTDTFERAYEVYKASRPENISPATIGGYEKIMHQVPDWFRHIKIDAIDSFTAQKVVNQYARNHSIKSTENYWGLIRAVLRFYVPQIVLSVKLPKAKARENKEYIPTDEDISRILRRSKGTAYEIPLLLATYGLRRGEIIALTIDDIKRDEAGWCVDIWKDKVQDINLVWHIKAPKTAASVRTVHISDYLAELILAQDYLWKGKEETRRLVYKRHPENIRTNLSNWQKELGIPHFSLHKMRHYYASAAHAMGMSDAEIMAAGGWETEHIMKSVYRHADKGKVSEGQRRWAEKIEGIRTEKSEN